MRDLAKLISDRAENGLHGQFEPLMAKKTYDVNDVEAGRAYTSAYVEFVHYAERVYDAAGTTRSEHAPEAYPAHAH